MNTQTPSSTRPVTERLSRVLLSPPTTPTHSPPITIDTVIRNRERTALNNPYTLVKQNPRHIRGNNNRGGISLSGALDVVNNVRHSISEFFVAQTPTFQNMATVVSQIFTRRPTISAYNPWISRRPTMSWRRSDYPFWRDAYRGKTAGLEVSGMLIKPLVSKIASWALGRAPRWRCGDVRSQAALEEWWDIWHPEILRAARGALKQGDAFLVINSDLTITLLPPECVEPIVNPADYGDILGWRVIQVLPHPVENTKMVVIDEYYPDRRIHWVEIDFVQQQREQFDNPLGILPIIHIPNQPDDGEVFGHAEAEGLLGALQRYGIVFDAAVEGNVLQGRPTPVIEFASVKDLDAFWKLYGTRVTSAVTGETTAYIDVDLSQIVTLTNGKFKYESPGAFVADASKLLELLFYLILEHTELPEFIFGNAIASSKASADTQMPVFIEFIDTRRSEMVKWLTQIAQIVLGYLSFTRPGVNADQRPEIQWEPLDQDDGRLVLDTVVWAFGANLLDEETALVLMPVDIEDPKAVLRKAKAEALARQELALQMQQRMTAISNPPEATNGDQQAQAGGSVGPPRNNSARPNANGRAARANTSNNKSTAVVELAYSTDLPSLTDLTTVTDVVEVLSNGNGYHPPERTAA